MTDFMNIVEEIIVENAKLKKEVKDLKDMNETLREEQKALMLREHNTQVEMHNLYYLIENNYRGLYDETKENFDLLHIFLKKIKRALEKNKMI